MEKIVLYGTIGTGEATRASIDRQLKSFGANVKNISLHINSPGGNCFEAFALYNLLNQFSSKVTAYIDGIAASAAALVVMAASKIIMPSNTFLALDRATGTVEMGDADSCIKLAGSLRTLDTHFEEIYRTRSRLSIDRVKALMADDQLLTADEAKQLGFCDSVTRSVVMASRTRKTIASFQQKNKRTTANQILAAKRTMQSELRAEHKIGNWHH